MNVNDLELRCTYKFSLTCMFPIALIYAVNFSDVKPSAVHVGNIVQGARMATASGRDMRVSDDESHQVRSKSASR